MSLSHRGPAPLRRLPFVLFACLAWPARAADPPPEPPPDPELDALRKAADDEAGPPAPAPAPVGGLSVSNPEISAVADLAARFLPDEPWVDGSGFFVRELELSFVSSIDHLAKFRGFVSFSPDEGVDVEELTVFWPGLVGTVNLTAGRFRQSLDPVNRWHTHALDQADLPLVHRALFGDEGLVETGVRLDTVFSSACALTHLVQIEVTNSENEGLFDGEILSAPAVLAHLGNHLALGDSGYVELGGGAIVGADWRKVYWGDLTVAYDPPGGRDRFALFLRGAFFYRDAADSRAARAGAYAYLHAQFDRTWTAGVRADWVEGEAGDPAVPDSAVAETFAVSPVLTFWQSEYLFLRLQYDLGLPDGGDATHAITLQLDAGIGPHTHDRY